MDSLTIAAAAGLRARLESLDVLANNIANSSTVGFKADRDAFLPWFSPEAGQGLPEPTDSPYLDRHWTDHTQGVLNRTGEGLDFAIHGRGFFEVQTPSGPRWTRAGTFRIDQSGKLETHEGYLVKVRPPPGREYKLNPLLLVEAEKDGTLHQDGAVQGVIDIVDFDSLDALRKQGSSYFRMDASSLTPKTAKIFELKQGYLENANGGVAESSVRLVSVLRQFEALQKAIAIGTEMNKRAIDDVARVNP